jgi:hypothetical protein
MTETLKSPELNKKGAPIDIIFFRHDDEHVNDLFHLYKSIDLNLRSTSQGNVVVFCEDAISSETRAKQIETDVASGIPPSQSLANALFAEVAHRPPDLKNPKDLEWLDLIRDGDNKFNKLHMGILDKHFIESGRIRVLWEAMPDEEVNKNRDFIINNFKNELAKNFLDVNKGRFKRGLKIFKNAVEKEAELHNDREDRFASRISQATQDENVIAVIGGIGGAHTRLGHILTKNGHTVTKTHTDKEGGLVLFDPANEAIRRKQFFPEKKIPTNEWYHLLISHAIYNFLQFGFSESEIYKNQNISEQTIIELSKLHLKGLGLSDTRSIRQFEKKVRQKGFGEEVIRRLSE